MNRLSRALWFGLGLLAVALTASAAELRRREWIVDGVKREALIRSPADGAGTLAPVVFVFHGHGGSMEQASRSMPAHGLWPEALVVYMQGLPTPGRLTDPTGTWDGWQAGPGEQGDRDLKFFDTVWRSLQTDYKIDPRRAYAMGHSNGGSFTYLLWAKRADVFAAFGPSAAVASANYGRFAPRPVIHIAGEHDPLVKFAWQKLMIDTLRRTNECDAGHPAGKGYTLYESKIGAPVMTYIHPGTHQYPLEATALIVGFFKQHPKS
jgi:polyhydroxybutyrate depolymerase